jgi:hypothetical protein
MVKSHMRIKKPDYTRNRQTGMAADVSGRMYKLLSGNSDPAGTHLDRRSVDWNRSRNRSRSGGRIYGKGGLGPRIGGRDLSFCSHIDWK